MNELGSDLALTIVRVAVGLILAAHGAQKMFGMFGGHGMEGWRGMVAGLGMAQPRLFATLAAFAEFFGGLLLAIGVLTPVMAAALAIDMLVAITRVHWTRGMWVAGGGYEYNLLLLIVLAVIGLNGAPRYSVDELFGIPAYSATIFLVTLLAGGLLTAAAMALGERGGERRPV